MNKLSNPAVLSVLAFVAYLLMALPAFAVQEKSSEPNQPIKEPVFLSPSRTWNTNDGKHEVVARLTKIENNMVVLKRVDNGWVAKVPINMLSEKDVTFLKQLEEQKKAADALTEKSNETPTPDDPGSEQPEKTAEPSTDVEKSVGDHPPQVVSRKPTGELSDEPQLPAQVDSADDALMNNDQGLPISPVPEPNRQVPLTTEPLPPPIVPEIGPVELPKVENSPPEYSQSTELEIPDLEPIRSELPPAPRSRVEAPNSFIASPDIVAAFPPDESSDRIADNSLRMPDLYSPTVTPESMPDETQPDIGATPVEKTSSKVEVTDEEIVATLVPSVSLGLEEKIRLGLNDEVLPRNPVLAFRLDGDLPGTAWRLGFMELQELVDQNGDSLSFVRLPPNEPNLLKGWVSIESVPYFVPIQAPINPLQSIDRVRGTLKVDLVTESVSIEIPLGATDAELQENPTLVESGISISVRRPDETTLHLDVSGPVSDIVKVSLARCGDAEFKKNQSVSRRFGWYQFKFSSKIPPDTVIKVQVARDSRDITVPFDFQNVRAGQ